MSGHRIKGRKMISAIVGSAAPRSFVNPRRTRSACANSPTHLHDPSPHDSQPGHRSDGKPAISSTLRPSGAAMMTLGGWRCARAPTTTVLTWQNCRPAANDHGRVTASVVIRSPEKRSPTPPFFARARALASALRSPRPRSPLRVAGGPPRGSAASCSEHPRRRPGDDLSFLVAQQQVIAVL